MRDVYLDVFLYVMAISGVNHLHLNSIFKLLRNSYRYYLGRPPGKQQSFTSRQTVIQKAPKKSKCLLLLFSWICVVTCSLYILTECGSSCILDDLIKPVWLWLSVVICQILVTFYKKYYNSLILVYCLSLFVKLLNSSTIICTYTKTTYMGLPFRTLKLSILYVIHHIPIYLLFVQINKIIKNFSLLHTQLQ